MWHRTGTPRGGFTLVELLVVIAIIGILVALLLPAVQAAREAARRSQCSNHLRNLALGWELHESAHRHYPTGGWGFLFVGEAEAGFGRDQPGGWIFNILPFIEESAIRDLDRGLTVPEQRDARARREAMTISILNCPSRRPAGPFDGGRDGTTALNTNPTLVDQQARSCYAANYGNRFAPEDPHAIDGFAAPEWHPSIGCTFTRSWCPDMRSNTGVSHIMSEVTKRQLKDGTSHTYLIGEKYIEPRSYTNGLDHGDDWSLYSGQQDDIYRNTFEPPEPDRVGLENDDIFGSNHPGGLHFAFGDCSVRFASFEIDERTFRQHGNRRDGQTISDPAR